MPLYPWDLWGLCRKWLNTGAADGTGEAVNLAQRLVDQCVKALFSGLK